MAVIGKVLPFMEEKVNPVYADDKVKLTNVSSHVKRDASQAEATVIQGETRQISTSLTAIVCHFILVGASENS